MELVTIESPSEIVEGDVIVAKYPDRAYTVLVRDISRVDLLGDNHENAWRFVGEPVTEVTGSTLVHHDTMTFTYSENVEQPDVVYAVR